MTALTFSRGAPPAPAPSEADLLPLAQKEELCRSLLAEFGVTKIHTRHEELIHGCLIDPTHTRQESDPTASLNFEKLLYNCLSAETVIKTYEGERRIGDLEGQVVEVLDGNGKWIKAPIRNYGRARLFRVTLTRNGVKKEVYTTDQHRWYIRKKGSTLRGKQSALVETVTAELRPKQRIPSVWPNEEKLSRRTYERTHWWVSSVEETDRFEDVFCAEVETTSSFVLAGNVLTGNCFGCGSAGGLVWLIAHCRHSSTQEARSWLAKESGLDGQVMELEKLISYLDALYTSRKGQVRIPVYSKQMLQPWAFLHPYLTDPQEAYGRGIPEANVIAMQIGYASEYQINAGGRTSERIVLPHFWKGDLVGWQTRRLLDDGTPKYLSSPDFPRESTIYNYQPANRWSMVVESMLSVVSHLHAIPQTEATFGANVTDIQMRLLAKHETLVLFMDNDKPGWKATEMIGEALMDSCNVLVVPNPYAADPDDMSTEKVQSLIDQAIPFSVWHRPERLLCHRCDETAHQGQCQGRG